MSETSSIGAFILAGGRSLRMGQDKAMLEWRGRTLLDEMTSRLLSSGFAPVRTVGRGDLPDRIPGLGPLGGIATALHAAGSDQNLIVAVDLPLLTPEFLKLFKIRVQISPKHVVAIKVGSAYPLCLAVHREALGLVNQRIGSGQLSVQGFIESADPEVLTGFDPAIFTNANTPEDWQRLMAEQNDRSGGP